MDDWLGALNRNGYALLPAVFSDLQLAAMLLDLTAAVERSTQSGAAIRNVEGRVYAARNVLEICPSARTFWRQSPLCDVLSRVLGANFGLVRGLFFDKPPDQSWALPWHKDLTIAIREHRLQTGVFSKPTTKAGVHHVAAPVDVLNAMLTLRIHLDDMTRTNGPLQVVPGSHVLGKAMPSGETVPEAILGKAGGVLLMRPLLAHSSAGAEPGTFEHRRVLHLEFSGLAALPDGYEWHTFIA